MRTDDGADDLEAIPPLDDGTPDAPVDALIRGRWNRRTVLASVGAVVFFVVGLSAGVVVGRRGSQTLLSARAPVTTSVPTRPTPTAKPSSTLTPRRGDLRTLFTYVSPTGAVVIARTGLVSLAEAQECPVETAAPFADLPGCASHHAEGVRFDFTAPGQPWYRLTFLTSHINKSMLLQPVAGGPIPEIRGDGSTMVAENPQLLLAVFRVRAPVAAVRVTLSDGTPETLTPIDGWAVIVGVKPESRFPFRAGVDGLDQHGQVVATTQVLRCC